MCMPEQLHTKLFGVQKIWCCTNIKMLYGTLKDLENTSIRCCWHTKGVFMRSRYHTNYTSIMNEIATCWIKHLTGGSVKVERLASAVLIYILVQPCIENVFFNIIPKRKLFVITTSFIQYYIVFKKSWVEVSVVHKEKL